MILAVTEASWLTNFRSSRKGVILKMGYMVCRRLCEHLPMEKESQEVGFTQPFTHLMTLELEFTKRNLPTFLSTLSFLRDIVTP